MGYQGCADKGLCYPPETARLNIDGEGAANTPATREHSWNWKSLLLFFLAVALCLILDRRKAKRRAAREAERERLAAEETGPGWELMNSIAIVFSLPNILVFCVP